MNKAAAILLLCVALAGCQTAGQAPIARALPPPPASMQPVPLPKVTAATDMRVSAYDHRQALKKANKRLMNSRTWYDTVRHDYAVSR